VSKFARILAVFLLITAPLFSQSELLTEPATATNSFTSGVEGPVCDAAGNLYACNFQRSGTIGKLTPDGNISVFAIVRAGGRASGLQIDGHGYLIATDYVNHAVYRVDLHTGEFLESLTKDWAGLQFHQPNDLGIAADDTIYFTDPDWHSPTGGRIFMITPGLHRKTAIVDEGLNTPNGVTVSPDQRRLYVSQSNAHNVLVYERNPDGTLRNRKVFFDLTTVEGGAAALPDGIRCDKAGNLFVAAVKLGRVFIVHPDGKLDPRIIKTAGKSPTNIALCGTAKRTLYVTEVDTRRIEKAEIGSVSSPAKPF
jgi:gluconolactonase